MIVIVDIDDDNHADDSEVDEDQEEREPAEIPPTVCKGEGDYCSPWPCGEMAPSFTQRIVPNVALSINVMNLQSAAAETIGTL